MSPLERRYRRLLIAYPRGYRMAYGEEMVGVLMESAGPAQRHPSAGDALHLMRHGFLSRARKLPSLPGRALRFDSPQWTQAAALFAFVGALLMTAKHGYLMAGVAGLAHYFPDYHVRFPTDHLVVGCVWLATTVALVLRRSRVGAALAGAAMLGELYIAATGDVDVNAVTVIRLTVAVLVAMAALLGRRTPVTRSWSMLGLAGAAAAYAATGALVDARTTWAALGSIYVARPTNLAGAAVLLAIAWVLASRPGPVRRRLMVFLAPPVAQLCAFEFYDEGARRGLGLVPPRLAVTLGCAAVLGVGLALLAVRRTERLRHLIALGREAEARARPPVPPVE